MINEIINSINGVLIGGNGESMMRNMGILRNLRYVLIIILAQFMSFLHLNPSNYIGLLLRVFIVGTCPPFTLLILYAWVVITVC